MSRFLAGPRKPPRLTAAPGPRGFPRDPRLSPGDDHPNRRTPGGGGDDVIDFLVLLGAWGPDPGHPADLDGSGDVGVNDFLILLANWGPCP
jgi:hypothetical protein